MKKTSIIILSISALLFIIGAIFLLLSNNSITPEENMKIIKETYTSFSINIVNNFDTKKELIDKLNNFNNDSYEKEHNDYQTILEQYNYEIKKINKEVDILENKCEKEYDDKSINQMCNFYQTLYETANNDYVKYMTTYNEKITEYNKANNKKYKQASLINKDYIDFDNNGKYESK